MFRLLPTLAAATLVCATASTALFASSHREAPFITELPKVDGTDFYMFRSYESGREGFVTLIANYSPLQNAYGGPNYFSLDPNALYEIHIDNDGDAIEDISFQFRFDNAFQNIEVGTGTDANGDQTANTIPLINSAPDGIGPGVDDLDGVNRIETYEVTIQRNGRRSNADPENAVNMGNGAGSIGVPDGDGGTDNTRFRKPVDNIGEKSINGPYSNYALAHVYDIEIPGCEADAGDGAGVGRVFAGQRKEGFVVNLGETFDLINTDPLGPRDAENNIVGDQNVTSLALELPIGCLTADGMGPDATEDPVIGGWTTASLRQARVLNPFPAGPSEQNAGGPGPSVEGGPWSQVSRLGAPLVNEVVIGLNAKDRFNASAPFNDIDSNVGIVPFVANPTLPVLINDLFPATTVPATPRNDLLAAFATGLTLRDDSDNIVFTNQPLSFITEEADGGRGAEMLRLNTAVAPAEPADQNDLGLLACDVAGFPNGRRPYDDVVDIALTVVEGAIIQEGQNVPDDPDTEGTNEANPANPNDLQTCDVSSGTPTVVNAGAVVTDGARAAGPTSGTSNGSAADPADTYLAEFPYLNTPLPGSPNQ